MVPEKPGYGKTVPKQRRKVQYSILSTEVYVKKLQLYLILKINIENFSRISASIFPSF